MRFLSGLKLASVLRENIANERLDAAVAYWGKGAVELLGIDKATAGSRVLCDAYSGACNPSEIEKLLGLGIEIHDCPGLHAKVYLAGDVLICGSANASANGLGREDVEIDLGLEAAVVTNETDAVTDAKVWFEKLAERGDVIGYEHIELIKQVWQPRRGSRPPLHNFKTLEAALIAGADIFDDRRVFLVVYEPWDPPEKVVKDYEASPYFDPAKYDPDWPPFFWDAGEWEAQPGDLILSYEFDGKKLAFDDMSEVLTVLQNGMILPVRRNRRPLGLAFNKEQADRLGKRIKALIAAGKISFPTNLLPLSKLARLLRETSQETEGMDRPLADWQAAHLALIQTQSIKDAYWEITSKMVQNGFTASPKTGTVKAACFWSEGGDYMFSFNLNPRHLLFYVRVPAQQAVAGLKEAALTNLPKASLNPSGEVTVRVDTLEDASGITAWLKSYLSSLK